MSFAVTFGTSAAWGMLLLSNLNSQNPEMSGFDGACCASAVPAQRNATKVGETEQAIGILNGVFIGVVGEPRWIAAATGRWNHTTLRKHTCRRNPCSKCTRTCEVSGRSSDPAM